jgi:propionyl-CoA carboxylase alpha chain
MKNDNIRYNFYYKGNNVELLIFEEKQYKYKSHMPVQKKVDSSKLVMSPMPGAIVSVSVKQGDKVVDGQQLLIIEAMKMQNIIKAEVDAEIASVSVKAGDSVAVDQVLIKFK